MNQFVIKHLVDQLEGQGSEGGKEGNSWCPSFGKMANFFLVSLYHFGLFYNNARTQKIGDFRFWRIAQDSAQDHEILLFEESCRSEEAGNEALR